MVNTVQRLYVLIPGGRSGAGDVVAVVAVATAAAAAAAR